MKFEIPGGYIPADNYPTSDDQAIEVINLLYGEPWVRLYADDDDMYSQWTVLERDKYGVPIRIASEEFDGRVEVQNFPVGD